MSRATFLGTSDDVTSCDCCGRTGLKSTVALLLGDAADPVYYGVTCAARALKSTAKEVRKGTRAADDAIAAARLEAQLAESRAHDALWQAYLDAAAGPGERFHQIERLGGFGPARDGFLAQQAA